ncbi:WXG100 family type VII secretion target [Frankia sp. AgKG'84/4]|uniref:WXG100 family type VII secretion target n=1 Tax=Frankia sp. AgKG'84/4 TaxID=573490 RepID=UPI00200C961D|nr:WXG100 family type VII secretion target [Frankia sp. AgKG'84/4]MCL9797144.1 WXG100 family type VII secretion target [Frankia sp. AgKG'84/4]
MADPLLISDETTTVAMILAFDECQDECVKVQQTIDSAGSMLFAQWGGVAAGKYRDAIAAWQNGFNEVKAALNLLNESMASYAKITTSTEDNTAMLGSNWAVGLT